MKDILLPGDIVRIAETTGTDLPPATEAEVCPDEDEADTVARVAALEALLPGALRKAKLPTEEN